MWSYKPTVREALAAAEPSLAPGRLVDALESREALSGAAPWYVRALVGAAAWFGGLFLLFFFGTLHTIRSGAELSFIGALLIAFAIGIRRAIRGRYSDFLAQLSLTWCSGGVMLFSGGFADRSTQITPGLLALAFASGVVLAAFPDRVMRTTSAFVGSCALIGVLYELDVPACMDLAAVGLALAIAWLWIEEPRLQRTGAGEWHLPVSYGLTGALFAPLVTSLLRSGEHAAGPLAAVGLGAILFGVALRILREVAPSRQSNGALAVGGAVVALTLLSLFSPGLMAALLALTLAFHRRHLPLAGLAAAFLLASGVALYYHLNLSFQLKSAALLGGGGALLAIRGLLRRALPVDASGPPPRYETIGEAFA